MRQEWMEYKDINLDNKEGIFFKMRVTEVKRFKKYREWGPAR